MISKFGDYISHTFVANYRAWDTVPSTFILTIVYEHGIEEWQTLKLPTSSDKIGLSFSINDFLSCDVEDLDDMGARVIYLDSEFRISCATKVEYKPTKLWVIFEYEHGKEGLGAVTRYKISTAKEVIDEFLQDWTMPYQLYIGAESSSYERIRVEGKNGYLCRDAFSFVYVEEKEISDEYEI
jgi:hypothetical protein